jgi:hypothetical protein
MTAFVSSALAVGGSIPDWLLSLGRYAAIALIAVLVVLGIVVEFELVHAASGGDGSASAASKTNCPACGARTTLDPEVCDYCEEPIER